MSRPRISLTTVSPLQRRGINRPFLEAAAWCKFPSICNALYIESVSTKSADMQLASNQKSLGDLDRDRVNNFDFIRFVAASLVIFSHSYLVTGTFSDEPLNHAVSFLNLGLDFGSMSVYVFFTISGYLITKSVFRQKSLGRFVLARALRIFPALAFCSMVCALIAGPLVSTLPFFSYFSFLDVYRFGLGNATLLDMQPYLPGVFERNAYPKYVNSPIWTLPGEILMYAVVFSIGAGKLFIQVPHNIGRVFPLVIVVCVYIFALQLTATYLQSALPWIAFFVLGMLAFKFRYRIVLKRRYLALLWLAVIPYTLLQLPGFKATVFAALAYSVFVFAYHPRMQIGNFSKHGDFSYGLYIYAFPVQQTLIAFQPEMSALTNFWISYVLVFPLAVLSWHFIENPSLKLKDVRFRVFVKACG